MSLQAYKPTSLQAYKATSFTNNISLSTQPLEYIGGCND